MDHAVKFVDGHDDLIEGMLAPFGGTDLTGEHFTSDTNFELDWFGDWERPLLYAHGEDPAIKTSVIGRIKVTPMDKGLWMQAQLDKAHAYKDAIAALVESGELGLSAGSIERFYLRGRDTKTGAIKHFPLIEGTLTPMPAHPEALPAPYAAKSVEVLEHLAVLGVAAPDALADDGPDPEAPTEPPATESVVEPATKNLEVIVKADVEDLLSAIKSLQAAVDALVKASEPEPVPPAPLLAVAGKSAEPDEPVDLEAFRAELNVLASEVAVKEAKNILG